MNLDLNQPSSLMDDVIHNILKARDDIRMKVAKVVLGRDPEPGDIDKFVEVVEGDFNKSSLYYFTDNKKAFLGTMETEFDGNTFFVKFNPNQDLIKTND